MNLGPASLSWLRFVNSDFYQELSWLAELLSAQEAVLVWLCHLPNTRQDLMASPEPSSSFPHFPREQEHEGSGANLLWLEPSAGPHTYLSPKQTRSWS